MCHPWCDKSRSRGTVLFITRLGAINHRVVWKLSFSSHCLVCWISSCEPFLFTTVLSKVTRSRLENPVMCNSRFENPWWTFLKQFGPCDGSRPSIRPRLSSYLPQLGVDWQPLETWKTDTQEIPCGNNISDCRIPWYPWVCFLCIIGKSHQYSGFWSRIRCILSLCRTVQHR